MSIYLNAVCLLSAMSQVGLRLLYLYDRSSARGIHEHTRESRAICS